MRVLIDRVGEQSAVETDIAGRSADQPVYVMLYISDTSNRNE